MKSIVVEMAYTAVTIFWCISAAMTSSKVCMQWSIQTVSIPLVQVQDYLCPRQLLQIKYGQMLCVMRLAQNKVSKKMMLVSNFL